MKLTKLLTMVMFLENSNDILYVMFIYQLISASKYDTLTPLLDSLQLQWVHEEKFQ